MILQETIAVFDVQECQEGKSLLSLLLTVKGVDREGLHVRLKKVSQILLSHLLRDIPYEHFHDEKTPSLEVYGSDNSVGNFGDEVDIGKM